MTARFHVPLRPLWLCRACAAPWPCATARLALLTEYRDSHVALSIYLAGMLYDAVEDLYRLNPHDAPKPAALHDRFLGWAAPRAPRPQPTD
ncbi:hypothetical protein [Micromonospora sp. C95]|uniref:hypothetical protein n=1 Tax=Micromonospora sp. C95 TaxID=2824882 RepID=UPI001B35E914|nr:hypothetical protein [Micromonospora sp. C95]MBQ1026256.1 hypothetical protein [Micromonospora sp. C95]